MLYNRCTRVQKNWLAQPQSWDQLLKFCIFGSTVIIYQSPPQVDILQAWVQDVSRHMMRWKGTFPLCFVFGAWVNSLWTLLFPLAPCAKMLHSLYNNASSHIWYLCSPVNLKCYHKLHREVMKLLISYHSYLLWCFAVRSILWSRQLIVVVLKQLNRPNVSTIPVD